MGALDSCGLDDHSIISRITVMQTIHYLSIVIVVSPLKMIALLSSIVGVIKV